MVLLIMSTPKLQGRNYTFNRADALEKQINIKMQPSPIDIVSQHMGSYGNSYTARANHRMLLDGMRNEEKYLQVSLLHN